MIVAVFQTVYILVCDPELIRHITTDFSKNIVKWNLIMFEGGLEKGLLFSHGEHWKKSRGIISNLFHFGLLKEREHTMYEVVRREVKDLEGKDVDLFKLGCKIGG